MIKQLYMCAAMLLASSATTFAEEAKSINGCSTRETVEKFLGDNEFVTLLRGEGASGKVTEIWINAKSYVVTIAYDKPANNKGENIKEVCVVNMVREAVYNGDTVDMLGKSLEKVNPKL